MASIFEQRAAQLPNLINESTSKNGQGSVFQTRAQQLQPEESTGKSALRYGAQIPVGLAQASSYGIATGLGSLLGYEALDPEEIEQIRKISEREGIPFDEEAYIEKFQEAQSLYPTIGNIAREIEERTGLPLEAKTRGQKALQFATSAGKLAPKESTLRPLNTSLPKPVLGAGVAGTKELLTEAGIPEPVSNIASFAILKTPTSGASKIDIGPKTKPSGMTQLQYEKLKKPTQVSESKIRQIEDRHKQEFTELANKIVKESPIGETAEALKNDVKFKQKTAEGFEELQKMAEKIPDKLPTSSLKQDLSKNLKNKNTGITPSEFEKSHNKFIREFIKNTPEKEVGFAELLKQYRKNNKDLGEVFEPGQSYAYNGAKREALIDYNKAIADVFEKTFPNSGFSKPFKELNEKWTKISDTEFIDKFLTDMFEGKIDYKKGRQFFDKEGMTVPFQRSMGKEGFAKFETLMSDLLSTEQANRMLKQARATGYEDLAKTAGSYILHPHLAKAKLAIDFLKGGYKTIYEFLLDKPQMAITWDKGVNAFKKGDFKAAQKELSKVDNAKKEFDIREGKRVETIKKFNDKNKVNELNKQLENASKKVRELQIETFQLPERISGKFDPVVEYDAYDRLHKAMTEEMKIVNKINQQKSQPK